MGFCDKLSISRFEFLIWGRENLSILSCMIVILRNAGWAFGERRCIYERLGLFGINELRLRPILALLVYFSGIISMKMLLCQPN